MIWACLRYVIARDCKNIGTRLVALAILALGLSACGGSSVDVSTALNDAFHPGQRVQSGQLSLSFALSGAGSSGTAQPLALTVSGPFAAVGVGRLPRFDLSLSNSAQGRTATIGTISTGTRFFVRVAGVAFVAPPSTFAELQRTYAQAAARAPGAGDTPLVSLGITPAAWVAHPHLAGHARVDGVTTLHITAAVAVPRFLADLNRITGAGSELALGGVSAGSSLSPAELAALSKSIDHATIDIYVGASDHLLRRLDLRTNDGVLSFSLGFSAVNRPVSIVAPPHPLPLSTLISDLQQIGVGSSATSSSSQTATSSTTTSSTSTTSALAGAAPPAYLRCYAQAGQDLAARAKCASLLPGG